MHQIPFDTLDSEHDTVYNMDGVGNRTTMVADGVLTGYEANEVNEYEAVGLIPQTHDNNGNLTGEQDPTNGRKFYYDYANRLVQMFKDEPQPILDKWHFRYDALGRRVERFIDNGTLVRHCFFYDGAQVLMKLDATIGEPTIEMLYIYGIGIDEPLTMWHSNNWYYYHTDSLGSVVALTDANGDLLESYEYDVYGMPTIYDGGVWVGDIYVIDLFIVNRTIL